MTDRFLSLAAPAKLNLYLHVTGKRADGYHLLDGLVAFADIHDTLTMAPADRLEFVADGPYAAGLGEDPDSNLVVRAAQALGEAVGRAPNFAFRLTKRLPVASGIGGGSADAAAALRGLARFWELAPDAPVLRQVAARLGSDIPVCVEGRAAFLHGVGTEQSDAPPLPAAGLLLVNPNIPLPTPAVYRARTGGFSPEAAFDETPATVAILAEWLSRRGNDLTRAAISLAPAIGEVLTAIGETAGCLLARMSGSGATCFGLYDDIGAARRAAEAVGATHSDWWVVPGRLLDDATFLLPAPSAGS